MEFLRNVGGLARSSVLRHLVHRKCAEAVALPVVLVTSRGMSSSKLFVGGLGWGVDEKILKDAFSTYGDVTEVRIIYDRDSGRSRGFGFVHFSNENNAEEAKNGMDGKELLGRPVRIDYAIDKSQSGGSRVVPRLSPLDPGFERNTVSKRGDLSRDWNSI